MMMPVGRDGTGMLPFPLGQQHSEPAAEPFEARVLPSEFTKFHTRKHPMIRQLREHPVLIW